MFDPHCLHIPRLRAEFNLNSYIPPTCRLWNPVPVFQESTDLGLYIKDSSHVLNALCVDNTLLEDGDL